MDLTTILLVALGLSLDAVAVSLAYNCYAPKVDLHQTVSLSLLFGLFQTLMPLAGWLAGLGFKSLVADIDHWLAFILLSFIGGRMIVQSRREGKCRTQTARLGWIPMLGLALATSIDALAVGLSFSALQMGIALPALLIGLVTFVLSFLAAFAGRRFGTRIADRAEFLGGLILVAIGLRILIGHLKGG